MRTILVLPLAVAVAFFGCGPVQDTADPRDAKSDESAVAQAFNGYMSALAQRDVKALGDHMTSTVRALITSRYGSVEAGIELRIDKERAGYLRTIGEVPLSGPFLLKSAERMDDGVVRAVFSMTPERDFDPLYFVLEDGRYRVGGELSPKDLADQLRGEPVQPIVLPTYTCNYKGGFVLRNYSYLGSRNVACGCLNVAYGLGVAWNNHYCGAEEQATCNKTTSVPPYNGCNCEATVSCQSTCGWFGGGSDFRATISGSEGACADNWAGTDVTVWDTTPNVLTCAIDC